MQTTELHRAPADQHFWMSGIIGQVAAALCGVIAVFVAIKTTAYQPQDAAGTTQYDYVFRIITFAALTAWVMFAIGLKRRGAAAMIVLGFATVLELIIVPMRTSGLATIAASNLGIVFAYCAAQLYCLVVEPKNLASETQPSPSKD